VVSRCWPVTRGMGGDAGPGERGGERTDGAPAPAADVRAHCSSTDKYHPMHTLYMIVRTVQVHTRRTSTTPY
jgi:hypothetical protein